MHAKGAFVFVLWTSLVWEKETPENPEYTAWAYFPAGAWVKHRHVEDSAELSEEREISQLLISRSPEKAVLEVDTVKIVHGLKVDFHRDRVEIHARRDFERGPNRIEDREVTEGEGELFIAGKNLKCRFMEILELTRSGKTVLKVWSCKEIPGGIVNMESRLEEGAIVRVRTTLLSWCRE